MKRMVSIILICGMVLMGLCACRSDDSSDGTGKKTDMFYPSKHSDAQTEDMETLSSVRSYRKVKLENPNHYNLGGDVEFSLYILNDFLYVPTGKYISFGGKIGMVILKYDNKGVLIEEISTPLQDDFFYDVRVLPNGDFLFLYVKQIGEQRIYLLKITDKDGVLLKETEIKTMDAWTYLSMTLHLSELDDGGLRIFVMLSTEAYYYDESLNLLQSVKLPMEFWGFSKKADGVYLLGNQMDQMAEIDMNEGTCQPITELPMPQEMKVHGKRIQYCDDGGLYCSYQGAIYRCDDDETATEILRWEHGSVDGTGQYWILDETSIYYLADSRLSSLPVELVMLDNTVETDISKRQVLTFVNQSFANKEWIYGVVDAFNQENEVYYIDMKSYIKGNDTPDSDQFDKALLVGEIPDLVLFSHPYEAMKYYDKNLFLDLSTFYRDSILGSVKRAYSYKDHLYLLPVSMTLDTLASADTVLRQPLTWEGMYTLEQEILSGNGAALISHNSMDEETLLFDFFDYTEKTANFDSEEFRQRIHFMERMEESYIISDYGVFMRNDSYTQDDYTLTASFIKDAIVDGTVKLLNVPFKSVEAYSALKRIFEGNAFTLCGMPTTAGMGARIFSRNLLAVFADSEKLEGCKVFIEYMLSDVVQTSESLTEKALPVTRSGLEHVIDSHRYFYYKKEMEAIMQIVKVDGTASYAPAGLSLQAEAHSAEYDPELAEQYEVMEITDEDKATILYFLETCDAQTNVDTVIYDIFKEEISAYRAGVKSLETVTKNMQSRISLYLNE